VSFCPLSGKRDCRTGEGQRLTGQCDCWTGEAKGQTESVTIMG
jgi:hypothetical protein